MLLFSITIDVNLAQGVCFLPYVFCSIIFLLSIHLSMVFLMSWNCRSIASNLTSFHFLVQHLDPHIICLQETWVDDASSLLHLKDYIFFSKPRAGRIRGGGLAILVKNNLPVWLLPSFVSSTTMEILCIRVAFDNHIFQIVNVHRTSGLLSSGDLLLLSSAVFNPCFFCGDFNARSRCFGDSISTPSGNELAKWVDCNPLILLNHGTVTRESSASSGSVLDLIFVSPSFFFRLSWGKATEKGTSDHFPIYCDFKAKGPPRVGNLKAYTNWTAFASSIEDVFQVLPPVTQSSGAEVNIIASRFQKSISRAVRSNSSLVPSAKEHSLLSWWNRACSRAKKIKNRAFRRARRSLCRVDWDEYKKQASIFKKVILAAKRSFWGAKICAISCPKKLFGLVHSINNYLFPNKPDSNFFFLESNNQVTCPYRQANMLGKGLLKKSPLIALRRPIPPGGGISPSFPKFSLSELKRAIALQRSSTPGCDGISAKAFKTLPLSALLKLLEIYNSCLSSLCYPAPWKRTIIVPIQKPKKPSHSVASYRPIALIPVISKILERMILFRLSWFAQKRKLFHPNMFGFLPGRSATDCLQKMVFLIDSLRTEKKWVTILSLDIKGAYDGVWVQGLVEKLHLAGLEDCLLFLLQDFVFERPFQVRWRGILSDPFVISCLPQGSILSPFLFNVYMMDLFESIPTHSHPFIYADDISIIIPGSSAEECIGNIQQTILEIQSWALKWKISFAVEKSSLLDLSPKRVKLSSPCNIGGAPIPWVTQTKILGLIFQDNFKWKAHAISSCAKAKKFLNIIKFISNRRTGLKSKQITQVISQVLLPRLDYANSLRFKESNSILRMYEVVENSAIRFALGVFICAPNEVIRKLVEIPPYRMRAKWAQISHFLKVISQQQKSNFLETCLNKLHISSVVMDTAKAFSLEHNVVRLSLPPHPSTSHKLLCLTDFFPSSKSKFPQLISASYLSLRERFTDYEFWATDGSKNNGGVGFGISNSDSSTTRSIRLPSLSSIFTAETAALFYLFKFLLKEGPVVILIDNKGVVEAIKTGRAKRGSLIDETIHLLHRFSVTSPTILVWCNAHSGIPLNEVADKLAVQATSNPSLPVIPIIDFQDVKRYIKSRLSTEFNESWASSTYFHRFSKQTLERPFFDWVPSRHLETKILRILANSFPLNSILHKIGLAPSPLCISCKSIENLSHRLLQCNRFSVQRSLLFPLLGLSPSSVSSINDVISTTNFQSPRVGRAILSMFP